MSKLSRREILQSGIALTAGSILLKPTLANATLFAETIEKAEDTALISAIPDIDLGPRERLLFDFDWRFVQGNAANPMKDLGFGKTLDYEKSNQGNTFGKTGDFQFATPEFDDSQWRTINLPHDWAVELPFVNDPSIRKHGYKPLGREYPETSVGWYRRTFHIFKEDEGRRIYINFDGIMRSALVFCNGAFIGRSDHGYVPFDFDLTDFLYYGKRNSVVVRADASFGDGWFYEGAGIYRHVWLTKVDALHIDPWNTVVSSEVQPNRAILNLTTIVEKNSGSVKENCRVHWQILDHGGKEVTTAISSVTEVQANGKGNFGATANIAQPLLWSQESPFLYYAVTMVEVDGKVRDRAKASFGVRTLTWNSEKGFLLNGEVTPIRGTCNHQDHAGVGAALPDRLQSYRLEVLKGMGCNAVRTSHNMPTPELVEACDRLGVLVLCETRTMSSSEDGLAQLSTMIRRLRNHPSIFLWSMGNEESTLQKSEMGPRIVRAMQQRSHEIDSTRLCTAGVIGDFDTAFAPCLEVMGCNYSYSDIDRYHQNYPKQF